MLTSLPGNSHQATCGHLCLGQLSDFPPSLPVKRFPRQMGTWDRKSCACICCLLVHKDVHSYEEQLFGAVPVSALNNQFKLCPRNAVWGACFDLPGRHSGNVCGPRRKEMRKTEKNSRQVLRAPCLPTVLCRVMPGTLKALNS
jgi:hypothetical protein